MTEERTAGLKAVTAVMAGLAILALWSPPLLASDLREDAPRESLETFHQHLATSLYFYPRHGAAPLGILGLEIYADASYNRDFDEEAFFRSVVEEDLPLGGLMVARVGVRKGLPARFNIGAAYGRILGTDLDLLSADLQWAALKGGAVTPALSFRATATRSRGSNEYALRQYGVEALLSKGLAIITPFVGAGLIRSEGEFDLSQTGRFETSSTQEIVYAGVTFHLLIPKVTLSVERGENLQGVLRVAFGF